MHAKALARRASKPHSISDFQILDARPDGDAGAVEPRLIAVELEAHVGRAAESVELVGHLLGVGLGVEMTGRLGRLDAVDEDL